MKTYHQKCEDRLLNVYRFENDDDPYDLVVGETINDPAEHHIEGESHTVINRID